VGVEKEPLEWRKIFDSPRRAVQPVARDRVPDARQMNANLMGSSRLDPDLQEVEIARPLEDAILGVSRASGACPGGHSRSADRVPSNAARDLAALVRKMDMHKRELDFLDRSGLKLLSQRLVGGIRARHDQQA